MTLSGITNKYFDIETITYGSEAVYRIESEENPSAPYFSFANGWSPQNSIVSENDDFGSLDPMNFEAELTGADATKQYIQFASTTDPYGIYS